MIKKGEYYNSYIGSHILSSFLNYSAYMDPLRSILYYEYI